MPALVSPTIRVQASFLEAMAEFSAEGRGGLYDQSALGRDSRTYAAGWGTPSGFEHYVADLLAQALEESPRPPGYVPQTTLWWVEDDTYLGRVGIRHRLTPSLLEVGGHIGYDVRPTARRQGHATAMLAAALPVARALGIDRALLTCDFDNEGSRKVILSAGGVLEDQRDRKLRFWVPTG
jgi:predicted acetyltransferase